MSDMQGKLEAALMPELLRRLYVGRKSGMLHFTTGDQRRSVRFNRGNIVFAQTNNPEEQLGQMLVAHDRLSQENLDKATEIVKAEGKRLGAVLEEQEMLTKEQVGEGLADHVREILRKIFSWTDGEYSFEEQPEQPHIEGDISLNLATGEVILEAVNSINDPEAIHRALGDFGRNLQTSLDPMLRFQKITLTPVDGFLMSRVDGASTASEILQLAPVDTEEAERSLFGLLCAGVIEFVESDGAAPAAPATSAGKRDPAPPPEAAPPAPEKTPESRPTPPAEAAPKPTPKPKEPEPPKAPEKSAEAVAAERRDEITKKYAALEGANHFDVLGIPRASNEAAVKSAYVAMARRFHPDTQTDPKLADLADKIEAIFIEVNTAFEVLRDPSKRANYESMLPRSSGFQPPGAEAEVAAPETSSPPAEASQDSGARTPPARPVVAGQALAERLGKAAGHFKKEEYWDAIQTLEPVIPMTEGKVRCKARILLARAYSKNPNWVKRAEEEIRDVLREDPKYADGYFELAKIYREKGLASRSRSMFKKVLEFVPDHAEALKEVGTVTPEPVEAGQPKAKGGLLKRLFKSE